MAAKIRRRQIYIDSIQQYNDGILAIYKVGNIAEPGNMPKDGLNVKYDSLRYEERTVGITRNNLAKQDHSQIDNLVRVQRLDDVCVHDVVSIAGKQYDIYQIQYINDVSPRSMELSLQRLEVAYEIK